MTLGDLPQLVAVALLVGLLIGVVGIGGVLLVPWLTYVDGLPVPEAVSIAMLAFLAPGAVALISAVRARRLAATGGRWLLLATIPGAMAGSMSLWLIPERAMLLLLAVALLAAGLRMLFGSEPSGVSNVGTAGARPGWPTGFITGFGSALTGTGGPMVLVPLVLWRGMPLLEAITLGQLVQLPIAASATVGNLAAGSVDLIAGLVIGLAMVPGMVHGPRLGRAMPRLWLHRSVAVLLVVAGVGFAVKAL